MADRRPIDIALVMVTKDRNGVPFTKPDANGKPIPDPMIFTRNYGVPEGHEVRFSLWDVSHEDLQVLMSGEPSDTVRADFQRLQHDRMQEMAASGQIESSLRAHADARRIADLERRLGDRAPDRND